MDLFFNNISYFIGHSTFSFVWWYCQEYPRYPNEWKHSILSFFILQELVDEKNGYYDAESDTVTLEVHVLAEEPRYAK